MADQEKIVIAVQVDTQEVARKLTEATKNVEELKQSNKDLQKEQASLAKQIKETGDATGELNAKMVENTKKMAANSAEIEANNRVVKSNTALLQLQTLDRIDSNATLDEQRQLLNVAQKAFASMTAEQKAAAGGAEQLSERIKDLSDRVKKQEAALGDNRRNVGNYTESILEADKELGGFGGSLTALIMPIKNATLGLKAMAATPIIAILSALVTIIMKLHERFKQNAAAMEQLTDVFGVFSGAANVVNVIIDKIAAGLGWIAEKALDLAYKLHIISDSMREGQEIAREDLAIQKAQQEAALKTAEDTKRIAELKAEVAEKDKYTAAQRLEKLKEANKLEEQIAQRSYELAKREYELQVKKNNQSASSIDDLKKENDLKIAMINAETALANKQKELNAQVDAAEKERLANEREAAAARLEIERKLEDSILELERDATQKAVVQAQRAGEREVENLRIKLDKLKQEDVKGRETLQKLILAKEQETQQKISDILIKATNEREQKARENARAQMEIGLHDAKEIASIRLQNAQEDYDRLKDLTKEQIEALYATQSDYQAAVIAAEKETFDAKEALAAEQYEAAQQRRQNEFDQRRNDAYNNEVELAQIELEQAAAENEALVNMDAETKARLFATQEDYEAAVIASNGRVQDANKKAIEAQRQMAMANASAVSGMMGALSNLLNQFGEENKEAAIASKAISLAKVAIDTGVAIAGGIAQAQSVPFPANLAAIATTIATIMTNIGTAISTIKSAKFATGGIVGGTSYTGDQVPVMTNSREMILNTDQQTRLFEALSSDNGKSIGFDYEMMAAAVAALPAPNLVLTELAQEQEKIVTINEIASV